MSHFIGFGKKGRRILRLNFEYIAVNFSAFDSYKTTILILKVNIKQ